MTKVKPFTRRTNVDQGQCACPLRADRCPLQADGEDRLCYRCRDDCQPDREAFKEED